MTQHNTTKTVANLFAVALVAVDVELKCGLAFSVVENRLVGVQVGYEGWLGIGHEIIRLEMNAVIVPVVS